MSEMKKKIIDILSCFNGELAADKIIEELGLKYLEEKEDMLTWLNGRLKELVVDHDGKEVNIWRPEDATSIEDMILRFCERNNINMAKEARGGGTR